MVALPFVKTAVFVSPSQSDENANSTLTAFAMPAVRSSGGEHRCAEALVMWIWIMLFRLLCNHSAVHKQFPVAVAP